MMDKDKDKEQFWDALRAPYKPTCHNCKWMTNVNSCAHPERDNEGCTIAAKAYYEDSGGVWYRPYWEWDGKNYE